MTDNNILKAFTVDCGTIKLCLQTKCGIYNVCDTTNINDSKTNDIKWFNAIWDTGATKSVLLLYRPIVTSKRQLYIIDRV